MRGYVPQVLALQEHLLVPDDVIILDGSQDAHLVESILDFLVRQVRQLHLFQRVNLLIAFSHHLEHRRICPLPCVNTPLPSLHTIEKSFEDI